MKHLHPCPSCRVLIDCGDKKDGARVRCKCGKRPVFRHVAEQGGDCWPECFELEHWRLGAPTKPGGRS